MSTPSFRSIFGVAVPRRSSAAVLAAALPLVGGIGCAPSGKPTPRADVVEIETIAVSYTHLTLPTIYSV